MVQQIGRSKALGGGEDQKRIAFIDKMLVAYPSHITFRDRLRMIDRSIWVS